MIEFLLQKIEKVLFLYFLIVSYWLNIIEFTGFILSLTSFNMKFDYNKLFQDSDCVKSYHSIKGQRYYSTIFTIEKMFTHI